LGDSRKQLQDITGQSVDLISYPFGRCNQTVRDAAEIAGYRTGFTMDFPDDSDDRLARGRLPVYSFDTVWSIGQKFNIGPGYQVERFKATTVNWLSNGTAIMNRMRRFRPNR
jgi:peptidoglycan/xylan/chitin deacetylase (PgdA/CDA1 family)